MWGAFVGVGGTDMPRARFFLLQTATASFLFFSLILSSSVFNAFFHHFMSLA